MIGSVGSVLLRGVSPCLQPQGHSQPTSVGYASGYPKLICSLSTPSEYQNTEDHVCISVSSEALSLSAQEIWGVKRGDVLEETFWRTLCKWESPRDLGCFSIVPLGESMVNNPTWTL